MINDFLVQERRLHLIALQNQLTLILQKPSYELQKETIARKNAYLFRKKKKKKCMLLDCCQLVHGKKVEYNLLSPQG